MKSTIVQSVAGNNMLLVLYLENRRLTEIQTIVTFDFVMQLVNADIHFSKTPNPNSA